MANSGINIALSKETSQHFAELAELTKESTQELAERLFREAVEREEEDILLSVVADEYDIEGAKKTKSEDVDWNTLLSS
ncbi:hypothetical protein ACJZL1_01585 [Wolbachia endosymbiont of Rhagoletis indifferens]|uniref:hypothetical protein n=1 Tax=unclassified Wolbachia TaxID=2640676 RepID=UPI00222EF483|nr:hypothetical protein [Wolbachia endosymbiont (group A) of Bibio marci]